MSFPVFSQNKGSLFVKKDHSTSPIPLAQKSTCAIMWVITIQPFNPTHPKPIANQKTTPRYSRPWRKCIKAKELLNGSNDRGGPVLLFFSASAMINAQKTLPSHSFFGRVDNWAFFYVSEVCPPKKLITNMPLVTT